MECNKDEAGRAKSIAERKLEQKDYTGAKKLALKAQSLYPGLEGISQLLTTLNVYVSAENKISGQIDWYRVLNVNPSADDDTIKRQYRKLALLLHPDKNSSIGADGSFKLILEAWTLLSDKAKRSAYNQRRGNKVFQQSAQRHTGGPSAPPMPTQQKAPTCSGGPSAASRPSQQKVPKHAGGPSAPSGLSQQKVPTHASRPSAPSGRGQQKVPTHAGGPSAPSRPSQQKVPAHTGGPSPLSSSSQQKVPTHTGAPSAPYMPSQQKVPTHAGGPSAPSGPSQQKVPTHVGGPSAPSRPNQQKVPTHAGGPSGPSTPSQQKVPTHAGGQSAPSMPSPQEAPTQAGGPSVPSISSQQKVPTHTGGPSTPSRPNEQKFPTNVGVPSAPPMPSQYSNCASRKTSSPKSHKTSAKVPKKPAPAPPHLRTDTFLSTCGHCNTLHKYPKIYRNCTILCSNCQEPFLASETAPPVNQSKTANLRSAVDNLAGRNAYDPGTNVPAGKKGLGQASFRDGNDQQGPLPGETDIGSTKPSIAEELKRTHTESNSSAGWEGCFKKRKLGEPQVRKQRQTCKVKKKKDKTQK